MRSVSALLAVLFVVSPAFVRAQDAARVHSVTLRGSAEQATLRVRGTFGTPSYSVRSSADGRTLIVDIDGATLDAGQVSGSASLIELTTASDTLDGSRLELRSRVAVRHSASAGDGLLELRLDALDGDAAAAPDVSEPEAHRAGSAQSGAEQGGSSAATTRRAHLTDMRIEHRHGRDRVVLDVAGEVEFRVLPGSTGALRMELLGADIDETTPILARASEGVVREARLAEQDHRVVLEVDRAPGSTGTALREGSTIVWLFAPAPAAEDGLGSRTIAREDDYAIDDGFEVETEEAAAFLTDIPLQVGAARGGRAYRGRRIDLDFNNADIHNILRLLADVGGVNIVTSDDVDGMVTIRMRNVPWDQALEVVLQSKGLGMVRRGNLIRVAPLTTLEAEREAAIARRKQQVELAPLETRLIPVAYATASEIQPRVAELLSPRGTVSVDERTNVLIARDMVEVLDEIEELIRTLDTQTPQVLVEARIVEATSQYQRDVGIQWGGDITMGTATGNPTGLIFPSSVGVAGGNYDGDSLSAGLSPVAQQVANPNYAVNLPAATGNGAGGALGISLGSLGGNVHLAVRLSAAESSGVLRIISSPRILTLDNHEAHIAQGTLIPYSQISAQGVQTAFQQAKLELRVRPHVTSDGSVSMHVRVTRDEPDFSRTSAQGDPTILKREAETDLLVDDGHTAVIGGIYSRTTGRQVSQVPFFGDIPILGVLFQRRTTRDDRSELLIFLTPRIVNRDAALRR